MIRSVAVFFAVVALSGCGSTPIRYYQPQLAPDEIDKAPRATADVVLSVETFVTDAAYDDQRIVYRTSDLRFDYYHFHRWSSEPGKMVSVVLREAYRNSGHFRAVVGGLDPRARVILSGRVVALEEVDVKEDEWKARVAVELTLRDNMTGEVLYNELVEETAPIEERSPMGVTEGVSKALTRLGARTARVIARASAGVSKPFIPKASASRREEPAASRSRASPPPSEHLSKEDDVEEVDADGDAGADL